MKFFDNNPRKISKQQFEGLVADLDEFGDLGGVVHDEDSDQVISANQRCRAFDINKMQPVITEQLDTPNRQGTIARGYVEWHGEKFSYRRVRWTPEKCKAANIIANVAGGSWDWDILSNSWDADLLKSVGFDDDLLRDWQQNSIALGEMLAAEGGDLPKRPEFNDIIEKMNEGQVGTSLKNQYWFFVEYYDDVTRFDRIKSKLKLISAHQIDGEFFYNLVVNDDNETV